MDAQLLTLAVFSFMSAAANVALFRAWQVALVNYVHTKFLLIQEQDHLDHVQKCHIEYKRTHTSP